MSAREITITLYENQLVVLIQMLEEVPAPLKVTRPIYESIMTQLKTEENIPRRSDENAEKMRPKRRI
jgi:hypothetical protein